MPDVQDPVAVDEMQSLLGEVRQLEQKLPREQERIVEYAERHLTRVRAQKIEYWITYFDYVKGKRVSLSNQDATSKFISEGEVALKNKDLRGLQQSVLRLYELLPESQEKARDMQKLKSGLDKF